jgi:hypothetical protein
MKCHDLGDLNGTKQNKLPCFIDNTLLQVVRQNALIITSLRDSFKFPPSAPYRRAACMKSPKKIFRMLLHVCKVHRNGLELGELRKLEIAASCRQIHVSACNNSMRVCVFGMQIGERQTIKLL